MPTVSVKLSDEEFNILQLIKGSQGTENISMILRNMIRLSSIIYDQRITINMIFKEWVVKLFTDDKFRNETPFCEAIKTIPELEKVQEYLGDELD